MQKAITPPHTPNKIISHNFRKISENNSEKIRPYLIGVNYGVTRLSAGWDGILLENMIHLALGEMYLNRLRADAAGGLRPFLLRSGADCIHPRNLHD